MCLIFMMFLGNPNLILYLECVTLLVEVSSQDLRTFFSAVRDQLWLWHLELSPSQTEALVRTMASFPGDLTLYDNVTINTITATKTFKDMSSSAVASQRFLCKFDSAAKYRYVLKDWAALLGWFYHYDPDTSIAVMVSS